MTTKLRTYPKYKPSGVDWLGDIPAGWQIFKFKGLFRTSNERLKNDPSVDTLLSVSGYRGVEPKDISSMEGQMPSEDVSEYRIVRKGQLAVNTMWLNYAGLGVSEYEGYISPAYRAYLIKSDIDSKFAHYLLRSPLYVQKYTSLLYGVRPNSLQVKPYDFEHIEILLPPLETQKRIADFLDEKTKVIDELVAKKEKLIELLREKRAAIITQVVTSGLDESGRPRKKPNSLPASGWKPSGIDWLGDIPAGWEICRIRFLVQANPSKSEISDFPNQPVSFLPMSHISENGALDLSEERDLNFIYTGYTYFRDGDVILAKITPCFENGKGAFMSGLTNGVGFGSTEFHVFRPKKIDGKFLYYFFASDGFMKFGELNMKGTAGQKRVPELFIKDFVMGVPKAKEQKQIADFLDAETGRIDKVAMLIESQIEELKEYRSSLIYHAVTGKIKI